MLSLLLGPFFFNFTFIIVHWYHLLNAILYVLSLPSLYSDPSCSLVWFKKVIDISYERVSRCLFFWSSLCCWDYYLICPFLLLNSIRFFLDKQFWWLSSKIANFNRSWAWNASLLREVTNCYKHFGSFLSAPILASLKEAFDIYRSASVLVYLYSLIECLYARCTKIRIFASEQWCIFLMLQRFFFFFTYSFHNYSL